MRAAILAGIAAVFLLAPAGAAFGESEKKDYEEQAREGLATLMMALESFIESIPQYELPEVLENGDIIIRRVHPEDPEHPAEPEGDTKQI